jgi:hypothetical protein
LFEPTIAMRYGFKKKSSPPLDIIELFLDFSMTPIKGISSDDDVIDYDVSIVRDAISEVWTLALYAMNIKITFP